MALGWNTKSLSEICLTDRHIDMVSERVKLEDIGLLSKLKMPPDTDRSCGHLVFSLDVYVHSLL